GQLINELAERYDLAGTYAAICFVILVSIGVFLFTERLERWLRPVDLACLRRGHGGCRYAPGPRYEPRSSLVLGGVGKPYRHRDGSIATSCLRSSPSAARFMRY